MTYSSGRGRAAGYDGKTAAGRKVYAPVVAGSAALLLQVNPKLTPNMVKALLMYTAQTAASST